MWSEWKEWGQDGGKGWRTLDFDKCRPSLKHVCFCFFFFFFSCHTCTNSDTCRQNEHTNPFSAAETRSGECWPSLLLTSVESAPPVCLLFEKWDISSIVPPQHTHNPIETAELKPPWDGELRHNVQYVLQGWLIGRLGRHFPQCGFIIPSNHQ